MSNFYDELDLRGLVIIEDLKNNKTIVKKHNMILRNAKLILLNKLLNGVSLKNPEEKIKSEYNGYVPKKIRLGWNDSDVKYTDNMDKISGNIIDIDLDSDTCEVVMDATQTYYILKFISNIEYITDGWKNIKGEFGSDAYPHPKPDNILINTLGIVMSNGSNDMLFSRISFDPIVISPDSDLKLTYYVYF